MRDGSFMSLLVDEDKRRKLVAQIEKTAEKIRQSQKNGVDFNGDYGQLFLLQPRNGVYSKYSGEYVRVKMVLIWFLIVVFLISVSIVAILLRKFDII